MFYYWFHAWQLRKHVLILYTLCQHKQQTMRRMMKMQIPGLFQICIMNLVNEFSIINFVSQATIPTTWKSEPTTQVDDMFEEILPGLEKRAVCRQNS